MRLTALALSSVLLVACGGAGDALVVVTLDSTTNLTNIDKLTVTAEVAGTSRTFDVLPKAAITIPPTYDFGIRVPPALGKTVNLTVVAKTGAATLATITGSATVTGGKRTSVTLTFGSSGADLTMAPADMTISTLDLSGADLVSPPDSATSCDETACGPCHDCGGDGTCSKLVLSADDNSGATCNGGKSCDPTGSCKTRQGFTCTDDVECVTGNCTDGVCCDKSKAMCGQCQICNKLGNEGTCVAATDGTDPDKECGAYNCRAGHCASNCFCPSNTDLGGAPCNNALDGYTSGTTPTPDCKDGYWCNGSGYSCLKKKCSGSCGYNIECGNNSCPYPSLMCGCSLDLGL